MVPETNVTDIQAESLKSIALEALDAMKANDVQFIDVRGRSSFTDFMVFASGTSSRHVASLAESVVEAVHKAGINPIGVEGQDVAEWVLVDLGDVIVHVMLPEVRLMYDIEKLWQELPQSRE